MNGMAIENQEDLSFYEPDQPLQESQEDLHGERLLEYHESHSPAIRDRGNHVASKPLAGSGNHGRLSATAIRPADLMVRSESHLVAPVNFGACALRLALDGRIGRLKPLAHLGRILLEG